MNRFVILSYADLKKYHFYYWVGIPAITPPKDQTFLLEKEVTLADTFNSEEIKDLSEIVKNHISNDKHVFIVEKSESRIVSRESLIGVDKEDHDEIYIAIASPSSTASGWTLRNILASLHIKYQWKKANIIQLKVDRQNVHDITHSTVITVNIGDGKEWPREGYGTVGWERNKNKLVPKSLNLSAIMDSTKLASAAVDLNLKLMKWRLSPNLDLDTVQNTKCLLLGAGTLGCNVARNLLSWGIRHITFVDYGKVSYSNPVRQWLYTYEDSKEGRQKASTAAMRLKEIFPEVISEGHEMTIPMPGHIVQGEEDEKTCFDNVDKLSQLIDDHDVIFLLLDSREARWLPTMLATAKGKTVFNVALGFDTFVVMRHGIHYESGNPIENRDPSSQLGCYFCNDIIAPSDTMKSRTLDQQCTVTRPGISSQASSIAVELLVSLLHHKEKEHAPSEIRTEIGSETSTELGLVPHQVRGFMGYFANLTITGYRYDKCVACSDHIIRKYQGEGRKFLLEVFNNPKVLEDVTGITQMKEEVDEGIEEWGDEDSFSM